MSSTHPCVQRVGVGRVGEDSATALTANNLLLGCPALLLPLICWFPLHLPSLLLRPLLCRTSSPAAPSQPLDRRRHRDRGVRPVDYRHHPQCDRVPQHQAGAVARSDHFHRWFIARVLVAGSVLVLSGSSAAAAAAAARRRRLRARLPRRQRRGCGRAQPLPEALGGRERG